MACAWIVGCAKGPEAPAPVAAAPAEPVAGATPTGNPAAVAPSSPDEVLAQNRASFDRCYAMGRAADPNLGPTRVTFAYLIGADGKPTTVDLRYRNRMDDKAKECMRDAALGVQFPSSMQGRSSATLSFGPQ
jgi:hypothetical protein